MAPERPAAPILGVAMARTNDVHARRTKSFAVAAAVAAALGSAGFATADASAMQVDPNHRGCWLPGTKMTAPSPHLVRVEDRRDPSHPRVSYSDGARIYQPSFGMYTCRNGVWYWGLGPS
jgi:hypothetical protein